jgi:hypothetical protein
MGSVEEKNTCVDDIRSERSDLDDDRAPDQLIGW